MNKLIFVCTGNTCRSPMAEMIFKNLLQLENNNDITVYSRGVNVYSPSPVASHVKTILLMNNIDSSAHCSKALREDDFTANTLILTMTTAHKQHINNKFPDYINQVYTLTEYVTGSHTDIQDPYGGDINIYKQCYLEIEGLLKELLSHTNRRLYNDSNWF